MSYWLGLIIGNSRLHWAWFEDDKLGETWDTSHLSEQISSLTSLKKYFPLKYQKQLRIDRLSVYLASVVPSQTALWKEYPQIYPITLKNIPLSNLYNTFGIDRALTIYGGGETYNYPCLAIDGGTALTFTGVDENRTLIGGAILPGLRSQLLTLNRQTAALPQVNLSSNLPSRWALNTEEAIASGILYTLIAGVSDYIRDWLRRYPYSSILLTGGDSLLIFNHLQAIHPEIASSIIVDRNLSFWGLRSHYLRSLV